MIYNGFFFFLQRPLHTVDAPQAVLVCMFAVLLCNLQWRENKIAFKVLWEVRLVFLPRSSGGYIWDAKGCKTRASVGSNLIDHYCCKNFIETHTGSCPWQSYTKPQQTKAFLLGGLRCPPRPDNMFSEWDSKGSKRVWEPEAHAVTDRTPDQSPFPIVSEYKKPERDERPSADCGRNDEGQNRPCMAFTNSTGEDKLSVQRLRGEVRGESEGTWGQNLPTG